MDAERALRYAYDQGFDEGYQAREMERVTYVLCAALDCRYHDGDDCTLGEVELVPSTGDVRCSDYERVEEDEEEE